MKCLVNSRRGGGRAQAWSSLRTLALCLMLTGHALAADNPTAQADALLAASDWKAAAAAYSAAAQADPTLGAAWFGLGASSIGLGEYDAALRAYTRALELEHRTAFAMFGVASAHAGLGHADEAIDWLFKMSETGVVAQTLARSSPDITRLSGHPRYAEALHALRPCRSKEHRQFDFWLGDWDVSNPQAPQRPKSHNRISSVQGGCVVLEEYDTPGGYTGVSLNFYDATRQQWHQTWMDNQGSPILHSGGIRDGSMVLVDDPDGETINRTTWTPLDENQVRQHWELSNDGGKTWRTLFDGLYTRRKPDSSEPSRQGQPAAVSTGSPVTNP